MFLLLLFFDIFLFFIFHGSHPGSHGSHGSQPGSHDSHGSHSDSHDSLARTLGRPVRTVVGNSKNITAGHEHRTLREFLVRLKMSLKH